MARCVYYQVISNTLLQGQTVNLLCVGGRGGEVATYAFPFVFMELLYKKGDVGLINAQLVESHRQAK